ncbi:hypothetical protein HDU98_008174, partial [Podochytrium sp. JEL0797]
MSAAAATQPTTFSSDAPPNFELPPEYALPKRPPPLTPLPPSHDNAINSAEQSRWPTPQSKQIVLRYWLKTHMDPHWRLLRHSQPKMYLQFLEKGYCEPITSHMAQIGALTRSPREYTGTLNLGSLFNTFETAGEERLYYVLNHMVFPGGGAAPATRNLKPINMRWNRAEYIRRGNARNARAQPIQPSLAEKYTSPSDAVMMTPNLHSHAYSHQVPPAAHLARTQALHDLAAELQHGTEHLEPMVMIEMSASMHLNPRLGVVGPDRVLRFHDQPSNIALVKNLVHRVLGHMVPRVQMQHADQDGVPTIAFGGRAFHVGNLSRDRFEADWHKKVASKTYVSRDWEDSTERPAVVARQATSPMNPVGISVVSKSRVMPAWQIAKSIFFEQQHL